MFLEHKIRYISQRVSVLPRQNAAAVGKAGANDRSPGSVSSAVLWWKIHRSSELRSIQGWSFQHLVDGVLPRLMQGWEVLQEDPNITVLVDYNLARFPVVEKIWEHLLPKERLVIFEPTTIFKYVPLEG